MSPTVAGPREVYCAIEHLHRDLLLARAICRGRFTNGGATIDAGIAPSWTDTTIHTDREWWIEWSKFYFGLDLAHAFAVTGDEEFARAFERLVWSWIQQVPADFSPTDATGRRLQNWIYAWGAFRRAPRPPAFEAAFELTLTEAIRREALYLRAHLTPERNHRTLELYSLFLVALALPETDPAGSLLEFSWRELYQNLLSDFRADGVQREHSTHYHLVALRSIVAARENARRFGLPVPAGFDAHLARALEFAMFCQRADGSIPALSDSDTGDYRELLRLGAALLGRSDILYVATDGLEGTPPSRASADFPEAGYCIRRSDWADLAGPLLGQRHLVFDCGPVGDGGHGHYDALNIELWAGRPLIVDPGRYTYAEGDPNWRHWFKGTAAHNTVCVDGLDQTTYQPGKPQKGSGADARLITSLSSTWLDVVGGEVRSRRYDAIHRRHVFVVAGDYWVVIDDLMAPTLHDYDLRFHLAPAACRLVRLDGTRVAAPGLEVHCAQGGTPVIEEGWVARQYGVRLPAPVVSIRQNGRRVRFVTVIVADDPTRQRTEIRVSAADAARGRVHIVVEGAEAASIDRLTWHDEGASFMVGPLAGVARAVWTRTTRGGSLLACAACGLQPADGRGNPYARVPSNVSWDSKHGAQTTMGNTA